MEKRGVGERGSNSALKREPGYRQGVGEQNAKREEVGFRQIRGSARPPLGALWVPLLFPPHCSLVPVVPTSSSGAGDRKEQEEKESAGERQRLELPTWGSELEARAWEGIKSLGGACVFGSSGQC